MRLYKFLDAAHVQSLAGGRFRFGSDRYYRLLELATGDAIIGDKREASAEMLVRDVVADTTVATADMRRVVHSLERLNAVRLDGAARAEIKDLRIVRTRPCYILSLSVGDGEQLVESMMRSPKGPRYSACIAIDDIDKLVSAIWQSGTITVDGVEAPLSEHFSAVEHRMVQYATLVPHDLGPVLIADPFLKDSAFSAQCEYRVVLFPKEDGALSDHVFVSCRDASQFLRIEADHGTQATQQRAYDAQDDIRVIYNTYRLVVVLVGMERATERLEQEYWSRQAEPEFQRYFHRERREIALPDSLAKNLTASYWRLRALTGANDEMDRLIEHPGSMWMLSNALERYLAANYALLSEAVPDLFRIPS